MPTQVVTEYVRTAVKVDGRPVDGIRYQSSRRKAQTALVLFASQDNLILEEAEQPQFYHLAKDRWIKLEKANVKAVTANDIAEWARRGGGLFGDM